jgi:hypothetical protein
MRARRFAFRAGAKATPAQASADLRNWMSVACYYSALFFF